MLPMPRPTPANAFAAWIATGFGLTATVPLSPGTVGATLGIPLWWAVSQAPGYPMQVGILLLLLAIGGPLCTRAARQLVTLGISASEHDPQPITYDEFTTVPVVLAFAPEATGWWWAAGFALHRAFDITKSWPCNWLERLPAGWGVMADDIAAAVYAGVCYRLLWGWLGG